MSPLLRVRSLLAALCLSALLVSGCESTTGVRAVDPGSAASSAPAGTASSGSAQEEQEVDAADPSAEEATDGSEGSTSQPGTAIDSGTVDTGDNQVAADTDPRSTLAVLATLAIKGRAAKTGYAREQFGQAWLDADRNGCDTRNDMLRRDLVETTIKSGTNGCVVLTGVLHDDYTGKRIEHVRGNSAIDVDHRVALSNAWQTGAFGWTLKKRAAFANDPLNLAPTDASANRQKGDGDAATWLPPNKPYRCDYVATQVAVKAKYGLWVTQPEHDAIVRVLADCPGHQLPADPTAAPTEVDHNLQPVEQAPPAKPKATKKASPEPKPEPVETPAPKGFADVPEEPAPVHFKNCTAAREAGAAPVRRGDPGYAKHLDRDGDGVGCE